jgi:heptosyltransferase I
VTVVREVCIVLLTGLGDVVHGLPVVNALKRAHPEWRITWVVEPMPAGILAHHPAVDEVVIFQRRRGWRGVLELRRALRARRFDLTLNLNYLGKSIWPTLFSGAPRRVGFERGRSRDGAWLAVNEHLAPAPRRHTQDMFLEFLDHLGIHDYAVEWRIPITAEERAAQAAFFAPLGDRPVAAVVTASGMRPKDWFADRYAQVVDALERDFGMRAVLVGGPGERETAIARETAALAETDPVWALGDSVRRLLWLLDGSRLVIAPDTGPLHIARAIEVPVVGLFGHTNPWRVGPYRMYEQLWVDRYTDPGEAPDPSLAEPRRGRMELITVQDVLDRVQRALREPPRPPYLPSL